MQKNVRLKGGQSIVFFFVVLAGCSGVIVPWRANNFKVCGGYRDPGNASEARKGGPLRVLQVKNV